MYKLLKQASKVNNSVPRRLSLHQHNIYGGTVCCISCSSEGSVYQATRNQSSFINTGKLGMLEKVGKKKRSKKSKKKYAELLEINKDSSNVTKAVVKKLTASHMSLLADRPEVTLEDLHKLKEKPAKPKEDSKGEEQCNKDLEESYLNFLRDSNFKMLDNLALERELEKEVQLGLTFNNAVNVEMLLPYDNIHEPEEVLPDEFPEAEVIEEHEEEKTQQSESKRSSSAAEKTKKKTKKQEDQDKAKKESERRNIEKIFNQNLSSYIDICVNCGFLNRAYAGLLNYYKKAKRNTSSGYRLIDVTPFNMLLHGFANKGHLKEVKEVLKLLKKCQITPTPQTYAACFECISRMPQMETHIDELRSFYDEFKSFNYTLNDLFTKCTYTDNQKHCVLMAVKKLDKSFHPNVMPPPLCYSCDLLQSLNDQVDEKHYRSPVEGLITSEELKELAKEQISAEISCSVKVKSVANNMKVTEETLHYRNKWNELEGMWRMSAREALARDLEVLKKQSNVSGVYNSISLYPYMRALSLEQLVDIILREIRKLAEGSETYSPSASYLCRGLGNQVRMRYHMKFKQNYGIQNKIEKLYNEYCNWYIQPEKDAKIKNSRQRWQMLLHENDNTGPSMEIKEKVWPTVVLHGIGKFLYNIIIKDIKVDVNVSSLNSKTQNLLPAFYILYRQQACKLRRELKPHPALMKLYKLAAFDELDFDVIEAPMVCPPVPWISVNSGGYILAKASFVRLQDLQTFVGWEKLEKLPNQQLYPILDSLNQLAAVPWTVNEKVLDVVLKVFRSGGNMKLKIPQDTTSFQAMENTQLTPDNTDKLKAYRERLTANRKKAEMYSLWCDALYRLSLANHFRGRMFWLPHNIDFRGRVYPIAPHLNHLGADMARSLLCFAKGKPLGQHGLDWLKLHCINLTGLKKRNSVADRLAYANSVLPDIIDSAEKPLTGNMWWTQSDDPWQTLACCMEIKDVLDSGNPETYISKLPIHQDGSCNGLQHYAALGRDSIGAQSVNLAPSDVPQDVYSCVVSMVEEQRQKDAENGNMVAQALEGFIQRKVIKQTVMTTVYGVTRFGARLQIAKQLRDLEDFPQDLVFPASLYLVHKTFTCLKEMFTSTREIQDWFTECATLISQKYSENVEWETPLGLLVVQPYVKLKKSPFVYRSDTRIGEHFPMDMLEYPNTMKQRNAFPPNFIHSLDSSHMMLTSVFCEREGITFVSVHDCYWTHPCTADIMNKICREQFVALHSQPILDNLSSYFQKRYRGFEVKKKNDQMVSDITSKVPKTGDFKLENVLNSVYFFS